MSYEAQQTRPSVFATKCRQSVRNDRCGLRQQRCVSIEVIDAVRAQEQSWSFDDHRGRIAHTSLYAELVLDTTAVAAQSFAVTRVATGAVRFSMKLPLLSTIVV